MVLVLMVSSMLESTSYNADKCLDRTLILPRALLEFLAFSSTEKIIFQNRESFEKTDEKAKIRGSNLG